VVAFLPRFVFLSSFVTNDNLVNLFGAILTLVGLQYVQRPSRWRLAVVGAVVGLLLATKLSTLPLVLVLLALSLVVSGWKRRAEHLGLGVLSAFVVSGGYLIQNAARYGDPLARHASARYLSLAGGLGDFQVRPYKAGNPLTLIFVRVPTRIYSTFWYESGWNQFHWSWQVPVIFWLVLAAALAGLVHRHVDRKVLIALLAIAIAGLLSIWGIAFQTATYQARYAFVALPAIAALVALGSEGWKLQNRFLLPAMGLFGTLVAIRLDVLAVHWY
jgi:4-amino-4-deoxy-L-arabinose transferase-like glycosyltransferase